MLYYKDESRIAWSAFTVKKGIDQICMEFQHNRFRVYIFIFFNLEDVFYTLEDILTSSIWRCCYLSLGS